jgi:hypothetical protein
VRVLENVKLILASFCNCNPLYVLVLQQDCNRTCQSAWTADWFVPCILRICKATTLPRRWQVLCPGRTAPALFPGAMSPSMQSTSPIRFHRFRTNPLHTNPTMRFFSSCPRQQVAHAKFWLTHLAVDSIDASCLSLLHCGHMPALDSFIIDS